MKKRYYRVIAMAFALILTLNSIPVQAGAAEPEEQPTTEQTVPMQAGAAEPEEQPTTEQTVPMQAGAAEPEEQPATEQSVPLQADADAAEKKQVIPTSATADSEYDAERAVGKALDGDQITRWAARDNATASNLILTFEQEVSVNSAYIYPCLQYGSSVNAYTIDYWENDEWKTAFTGEAITNETKETNPSFDTFRTTQVRLHIDGNKSSIYEFQLFYQEEPKAVSSITIAAPEVIAATGSTNKGCTVYDTAPFTITGTCEGEAASVEVQIQEESGGTKNFQTTQINGGNWSIEADNVASGKISITANLKNASGDTVACAENIEAILRNEKDLARGKEIVVSTGYNGLGGDKAVDGKTGTRWAPNDSDKSPSLTVKLGAPTEFNRVIMREMFAPWNGENAYRCSGYKLEYLENDTAGEWKTLKEGTGIGEEAVLDLDSAVTGSQIRVTLSSNAKPASLETFEVYHIAREEQEQPVEERPADTVIEAKDYQKAQITKTAAPNEDAPDHSSLGGEWGVGDYLVYRNIHFGDGSYYKTIMMMAAAGSDQAGKKIEVHADSADGDLLGTIELTPSGSKTIFREQYAQIKSPEGVHDVFFVFSDESDMNIDFFVFSPYTGTESEEEKADRMSWWRNDVYGMFIHFGAFSQLEGEYKGEKSVGGNKLAEWIMSNENISREEYEEIAARPFNPVQFDVEKIVSLAKAAGHKYIVFTTKHHEGFNMYDTGVKGFEDYKITGFGEYKGEDPLKALSEECQKQGVDLCAYITVMDWHDDSQSNYGKNVDPAKKADFVSRYKAQLRELVEIYGAKVLWFDGDWESWWTKADGEELYKYLRTLDVGVITNERLKRDTGIGDIDVRENSVVSSATDSYVESCMTLNNTWGFSKYDHNWKSADQVVDMLVQCASNGGNLILNIGPKGDGSVPKETEDILKESGEWVKIHADSIYGTKGSCMQKLPTGVRMTTKEGKAYLHLTTQFYNDIMIPRFENKITDMKILGTGEKVTYSLSAEKTYIRLSDITQDVYDTVIEIDMEGIPKQLVTSSMTNLAVTAKTVTGTNEYSDLYAAGKAVDGDRTSRWATKNISNGEAELVLNFENPVTVNSAYVSQYVSASNYTNAYTIDYWKDGKWITAFRGGKLEAEADITFEAVTSDKIRLHLTQTNNPSIYEFQLFRNELSSVAITNPKIVAKTGSNNEGVTVYDESPFRIEGISEGTADKVEVAVLDKEGARKSFTTEVTKDGTWSVEADSIVSGDLTVSAYLKDTQGGIVAVADARQAILRNAKDLARGKKATASTQYGGFEGSKAVDGMTGTRWAPNDSDVLPALTVDLGADTEFDRVIMREMIDRWNTPADYRCNKFKLEYYDGTTWQLLKEGTKIGEEYILDLTEPITASQVRMTFLQGRVLNDKTFMPSLETFELYRLKGQSEPEKPVDVRTADTLIEAKDYQKAGITGGNVSENDNAPDHTSYGGDFKAGDYLVYRNLDFKQKSYNTFMLMVSALDDQSGKQIEVRLDGVDGDKIGTITVEPSKDRTIFREQYADIKAGVSGKHDIYLVFPQDAALDLDFFNFSTYDGTETKEEMEKRMSWFRDSVFGQFIHFGAYTYLEGEWNGGPSKGLSEWIMEKEEIGKEEYALAAAKPFNPDQFNAKEIVELAKAAGQKYIVFTSRHHEGFSMFDTHIKEFEDYKLQGYGAYKGGDFLKELSKECKKAGIHFCLYITVQDWHDKSQDAYSTVMKEGEKDDFMSRYKAQLRELLEIYQPDMLWFDGEWQSWWTAEDGREVQRYLRTIKPELVTNNRLKRSGNVGDYGTPEGTIPETGLEGAWETCMTLNNTWGWDKYDHNWKNADTVIDMVVQCASGGGNLLLNIGPEPDGTVPPESAAILREAGKWMEKYGDSIYGTERNCLVGLPSGVRMTTKDGMAYLHITQKLNGDIQIPRLDNEIKSMKVMGTNEPVNYLNMKEKTYIELSKVDQVDYDTVIEIELEGKPKQLVTESATNIAPTASSAEANTYWYNSETYKGSKAVDDDATTRWASHDKATEAILELEFDTPVTVNAASFVEYYSAGKNYINTYTIDYWKDGQWVSAYRSEKSVHDKPDVTFDSVTSDKIRLNITDSLNPSLYEFKLFKQARDRISITSPAVKPQTSNMNEGRSILEGMPVSVTGTVSGAAKSAEVKIMDSTKAEKTFAATVSADGSFEAKVDGNFKPGAVFFTAYAKDKDGQYIAISDVQEAILRDGKDLTKGKKATTSTAWSNFEGDKALDGMTGTRWAPKDDDPQPTITVDLEENTEFNRVIIREMYDRWNNPKDYRCQKFKLEYYDGSSWKKLHEGTKIGEELAIDLEQAVEAKQIRLTILEGRTVGEGDKAKKYAPGIESFELYNTVEAPPVTPPPTTPPITPPPTTPPVTPPPTTPPVTPPPTDNPHNPMDQVRIEVNRGEGVPAVRPENADILKDILLTEEEKAMAADGVKIVIRMVISKVDEGANAAEIGALKGALKDRALGTLLNIQLFKQIGSGEPQKITETGRPFRIVLEIPQELKPGNGVNRTYTLLSLHDQLVLEWKDLDENPDTITAEIDKFSLFAVVYQDKEKPKKDSNHSNSGSSDQDQSSGNQRASAAKTGDDAPVLPFILLTAAGASLVTVLILYRRRMRSGKSE
ncbi:alpha-L-fucosidase [Diplocloster hominis]|uniref:alpha-L-fucosidase n=1 Tax=Diplocloster hominis TaxID=3079010 RepID=UPI0031B9D96B